MHKPVFMLHFLDISSAWPVAEFGTWRKLGKSNNCILREVAVLTFFVDTNSASR